MKPSEYSLPGSRINMLPNRVGPQELCTSVFGYRRVRELGVLRRASCGPRSVCLSKTDV